MSPRIAILVHFRAEHGGLHDHVRDQVGFARDLGYEVTLACPPGPFAESMRATADVVTVDHANTAGVVAAVLERGTPELIHAHPGLARQAAFALKSECRAPLLVTYHGSRPETLSAAEPQVDIAITVSDLTRRFILKRTHADPARIVVIPNAVDVDTFVASPVPERDTVLLASRWDEDKGFVVDVALEALHGLAHDPDLAHVDVVVAGDGSRLADLASACAEANAARGRLAFRSLGWLSPTQLAVAMSSASVVMSPGRGALQSMAVGRATIALGSKGYVGFLRGDTLLRGMDANFGSGGIGPRQYPSGLVLRDLSDALAHARHAALLEAYAAVVRERTLPMVRQAHARVWSIAASGTDRPDRG